MENQSTECIVFCQASFKFPTYISKDHSESPTFIKKEKLRFSAQNNLDFWMNKEYLNFLYETNILKLLKIYGHAFYYFLTKTVVLAL